MSESLERFYENLLEIEWPWEVASIKRESQERIVTVKVKYKEGEKMECPVCKKPATLYDYKERRWRHLDSCNHQTIIEAKIPRVKCSEHNVKQVPVNWAEKNSRFTIQFEKVIIMWLQYDAIATVAKNFDLTWDQVAGIRKRAVERGLRRRKKTYPKHIGIDEVSFRKHHKYATVILDKEKDAIIDILDNRKASTLEYWFKTQDKCDFTFLESISMDMWDPFIKAVKKCFKNAEDLIAFDRFHVSGHFNKALNKIRAKEHRELNAVVEKSPLTRTKFQWLRNSNRTDNRTKKRREFFPITRTNLKTASALS